MTRLLFVTVAGFLVAGCGQRDAARAPIDPPRTEAPAPAEAAQARAEAQPDRAASLPVVARLQVPVTLHSPHESLDACSWGAVRPWRGPPGDSVDVRSGPGPQYPVVERLATGHEFGLCDGTPEWVGVIYTPGGQDAIRCGPLGTPVPEPIAYAGPCKSGWIQGDRIEVIAG
jgi:hypothetical protein